MIKSKDDRAKRETPRIGKPATYFLYRDGAMENAYTSATEALAGLKNEPVVSRQQVYIGDDTGAKYAEKEPQTRIGSTGYTVPDDARITATPEFEQDLAHEAAIRERDGIKPEVQKPDQELARQDKAPDQELAKPEVKMTAVQALAELRNVSERFDALRTQMQQRDPQAWEAKLSAALKATPVPQPSQRQAWETKLDQPAATPSQPIAQALAPWQQQLNASGAARESQPQTPEAERQAQQQAQRQTQLETPGR
jgi:hypothetical protein